MLTLRGSHRDLHEQLCFEDGTNLDLCVVRDGGLTIDSRKSDGPYSKRVPSHWRGLSVPIVYGISKNGVVRELN